MNSVDENKKSSKFVPTKRNKGLEPVPVMGGHLIMGYSEEIHGDDSTEFTYKLPLGAIKRLIKSYYENLRSICEASTYLGQSGSSEIRLEPYCRRMISDIVGQLNKNGLNGEKIEEEVFDQYFKANDEKLKRFRRNHGFNVMESFKPCNDPECCEPNEPSNETKDL